MLNQIGQNIKHNDLNNYRSYLISIRLGVVLLFVFCFLKIISFIPVLWSYCYYKTFKLSCLILILVVMYNHVMPLTEFEYNRKENHFTQTNLDEVVHITFEDFLLLSLYKSKMRDYTLVKRVITNNDSIFSTIGLQNSSVDYTMKEIAKNNLKSNYYDLYNFKYKIKEELDFNRYHDVQKYLLGFFQIDLKRNKDFRSKFKIGNNDPFNGIAEEKIVQSIYQHKKINFKEAWPKSEMRLSLNN